MTVFEAEIKGILKVLYWAGELGISNIVFESDSMLSVTAIGKEITNVLEVGHMIQECRNILEVRHDFSLIFITKQANKVAHSLARVPCKAFCFYDFLSPPQTVLESLMYYAYLN